MNSVLPGVMPIIGASEAEAKEKLNRPMSLTRLAKARESCAESHNTRRCAYLDAGGSWGSLLVSSMLFPPKH
jgi:hypothetical protein